MENEKFDPYRLENLKQQQLYSEKEIQENLEDVIELGSLPELEISQGEHEHIVINEKKEELAKDPTVAETREILSLFLKEEMPYLDEKLLAEMDSSQLIKTYFYYYNQEASFLHFIDLVSTLGTPKIKEAIEEYNDNQKELKKLLTVQYFKYLYNKIPIGLKEGRNLQLYEKVEDEVDLDSESPEDLPPESQEILLKAINHFINLHKERKKINEQPLVGFHTSGNKIQGNAITATHGHDQVNIIAQSGKASKVGAGERFLSYKLNKLYPGEMLYLIDSSRNNLSNVYDIENAAATSHSSLTKINIPEYKIDQKHGGFNYINLTPDVMKDLDAGFGAK